MKPPRFEYLAPEDLDEAVAALAEYGEEARVLAGGQSLMPMLAFRLAAPALLVDLNRVRAMDYIRHDGNRLLIGAMTRQRTVERLPGLQRRCAVLAEGVGLIGHIAIRNRGTGRRQHGARRPGGRVAGARARTRWRV